MCVGSLVLLRKVDHVFVTRGRDVSAVCAQLCSLLERASDCPWQRGEPPRDKRELATGQPACRVLDRVTFPF
jgi:hypothetical protein